jgi:long-chain acyl-CoA synthetase
MAFNTLNEVLRYGASMHPKDDAFLVREGPGALRAVSTRDFFHRARLVTLALNAMGIQKGDRVALWSENRFEWMLADFGVLFAGAATVPLYTNASPAQATYILRDSGAKAIFVSNAALLDRALAAQKDAPELQFIFTFEKTGREDGEKVFHLSQLEEKGAPVWETNQDLHRQLLEGVTADDLASIVYTSGTTGEPKGVMLTQGNLGSNVQACADRVELTRDDRAVSFLPLCHIFERTTDYMYFFSGVTIAHVPDPKEAPAYIRDAKPTVLTGVPRFYEKLHEEIVRRATSNPLKGALARWGFRAARDYAEAAMNGGGKSTLRHRLADALVLSRVRAGLAPLRLLISGGAPLHPDIGKFFHGAGFLLLEGYGLTETSPVACLNPPERVKHGTVGKPLRGVEVKTEADGELLIRGPLVMKGYWNKEDATKEALPGDGWLRTGDLAEIDKDGYVRITGRKKELIVTAGGKNVAPRAVEERLAESPLVEQAVVFGDRKKFIAALIAPNAAALREKGVSDPSSAQAHALVEADIRPRMAGLADYEQVKKFALVAEPFSVENGLLTPTLKYRRAEIEKKHAAELDGLYR